MKLGVIPFGRKLLETEDLDPIYTMLHRAELPLNKLQKWLLAYWCFYNAGTSSWIVDQLSYWDAMETAAKSSFYPRGTERRHFRGALAVSSVESFLRRNVGEIFQRLTEPVGGDKVLSLTTVMDRVQAFRGFGPWIAFKAADMLERLGIVPISFTEADTFLFESPREGAARVVQHYANGEVVGKAEEPGWAFRYLQKALGSYDAPPRLERKVNGQEFETILCKWKSHLSGHYEVGKDIHEIYLGLIRFKKTPTAQGLLKCLPKPVSPS